jgi:flagellar motor switch protein FliM
MADEGEELDQDALANSWSENMFDEGSSEAGSEAAEGQGNAPGMPAEGLAGDFDEQAAMAEAWNGDEGDRGDDQDALASAWGADGETGDTEEDDSSERVLNQEEIDNLLGFELDDDALGGVNGLRAIANSALVSYERLPMLEIVFDRLVRLMTTSLRNFTSDNVEVSFDNITTIRFGDYLNSIPLPAMLAVFKTVEWDNYGLVTVDSKLIYAIVDVLLGGRSSPAIQIEGRPYTTIETTLVQRMLEVILDDMETAFKPLSPVSMNIERLETNPRFAAIARSSNAAILVKFRIDMEGRGGEIEIMLPYATLEPIRDLLLQGFMGEKFGQDSVWEGHLATEIWSAKVQIEAVLGEIDIPLEKAMNLAVGEAIVFNNKPQDPIEIRCGDIPLTMGSMGQANNNVSVRLNSGITSGEKADMAEL